MQEQNEDNASVWGPRRGHGLRFKDLGDKHFTMALKSPSLKDQCPGFKDPSLVCIDAKLPHIVDMFINLD